jgi:hypothetical protein
MAKQEAQSQKLTVKDLAARVGISEVELRKILRSQFSGIGKGKQYGWDADDPVVQEIVSAATAKKQPKQASKPEQ